MSAANYIEKMQTLQKSLIDFLDVDQESDESFINFRIILDSQKIREDKNNLITIIDILINIFNNHHRTPFFISRIEQILNYIKESIKQHFTQQEIFNIFKYNKRLLLYFIKGNLITIDENMAKTMSLYDPIYFYPEISCFEKAREIMNNNFCNSNAKLLGVTATAFRGDNKSLEKVYTSGITYSYDIVTGIYEGYLSHVKTKLLDIELDVSQLRIINNSHYAEDELDDVLEQAFMDKLGKLLAEEIKDKKTVIFTHSLN